MPRLDLGAGRQLGRGGRPRRQARHRRPRLARVRSRGAGWRTPARPPRYSGRDPRSRRRHRRACASAQTTEELHDVARARTDLPPVDPRDRRRVRLCRGSDQRRRRLRELQGRLAFRRRDGLYDGEERDRRRVAPRARAAPPRRRVTVRSAHSASAEPPRLARPRRARLHRRQRPVRALLRRPLPRDRDAGRIHPEDARHLGRAARGAAPARARAAGASGRDRARRGRPGVARRRRRDDRLRWRRGDDPRGHTDVGCRGDLRQASRRGDRPADSRGRTHGVRRGDPLCLDRRLGPHLRACRPERRAVAVGDRDRIAAHGVRRHLVRSARLCPGHRRHRGPRLRRRHHRGALRNHRRRGGRRRRHRARDRRRRARRSCSADDAARARVLRS